MGRWDMVFLDKLKRYPTPCGSQIPDTQGLKILQHNLANMVDIQGFKEGVDVFLLRVLAGVKDAVDLGENWQGLHGNGCTLAWSITLVLPFS